MAVTLLSCSNKPWKWGLDSGHIWGLGGGGEQTHSAPPHQFNNLVLNLCSGYTVRKSIAPRITDCSCIYAVLSCWRYSIKIQSHRGSKQTHRIRVPQSGTERWFLIGGHPKAAFLDKASVCDMGPFSFQNKRMQSILRYSKQCLRLCYCALVHGRLRTTSYFTLFLLQPLGGAVIKSIQKQAFFLQPFFLMPWMPQISQTEQ